MAHIKEPIRQKVSQAFDVFIPPSQWEQYVDLIDKAGWSRKQMLTILMLSCQQIERLEGLIEDLYFQLEIQAGQHPDKPEPTYFHLRTSREIHEDLDKIWNEQTKAFYVSSQDFKILEKKLDPNLAKNDAQYGYSKDVDPKDGIEKTCLLYRNLPVFRNKV